jgi:hypothetical protein
MPQLLYPQGKSFWYPLDRRLGGASELAWMLWNREIFFSVLGIKLQASRL